MKIDPCAKVLVLSMLVASGLATVGCGEDRVVVTPGTSTSTTTNTVKEVAAPAKTEVTVTTPAAPAPAASPGH